MNQIVKNALRLIPTRNVESTTKCLRSMCHVKNHDVTENLITSDKLYSLDSSKCKTSQNTQAKKSSQSLKSIFAPFQAKYLKSDGDDSDAEKLISKTIGNFGVTLNSSDVRIKCQQSDETFIFDPAVNIKVDEKLSECSQNEIAAEKKTPRDIIIPSKLGKFNMSLDNGKLILKTPEGDQTFIFKHSVDIEVCKESTKIEAPPHEIEESFDGFKIGASSYKALIKTEEGNKIVKLFPSKPYFGDPQRQLPFEKKALKKNRIAPLIGNISVSLEDGKMSIKKQESDEIFIFKHNVEIQFYKEFKDQKKVPADEIIPLVTDNLKLMLDSGKVTLRTQDNEILIFNSFIHIGVNKFYTKMKIVPAIFIRTMKD